MSDARLNSSPKMQRAAVLISALCNGQIDEEQFHELDSLICEDEQVARLYVTLMHLDAAMYHFASYFAESVPAIVDTEDLEAELLENGAALRLHETMVVPAVLGITSNDSDDDEEIYQPKSVLVDRPDAAGTSRISAILIRAGIAAVLMISVGFFIYALVPRTARVAVVQKVAPPTVTPMPPIPVATIELAVEPVWEADFIPPPDGNFVAGQLLSLKRGDVQLSLRRGGRLVVEGPAEIQFESDGRISVHRGRIVATVPGGGLVVECPLGTVTDLGTQFGVAVRSDGSADVAVFEGRISASLSSSAPTPHVPAMLLNVGQAAIISHEKLSVNPQGAIPQQFVCHLVNGDVKFLDVTDLVSGGDGTTRRRGLGINANTGESGSLPPIGALVSNGKYHSVKGFPVIDGVFVPDGNRGEMIVDSVGHRFAFPDAGDSAWNNIYTGGHIPWPNGPALSTIFDGVDYSSPDHGIICIHPNNALTLDLDAIRRLYPDRTLTSFQCKVCNSASTTVHLSGGNVPIAKLYVLVDGNAKYSNEHYSALDGALMINVPLSKNERFLTLASTDARKNHLRNHILWADAKLAL